MRRPVVAVLSLAVLAVLVVGGWQVVGGTSAGPGTQAPVELCAGRC